MNWIKILVICLMGAAVGEAMRRQLNRLTYRCVAASDESDVARTVDEVDETALPAPGVRWWIPVVLGIGWGCVGWRCSTWLEVTGWANLLGWLAFSGIGLWMAAIDLDVRRLPDRSQILLAVVSVGFGVVICWEDPIRLAVGLGTGLACGLVFFIMHAISRGSLGLGDVKLVLTCGWWLGLISVAAVFAGLVISCVLAVAYSLLAKQRQFAFGPWLVAGTVIAGLMGQLS